MENVYSAWIYFTPRFDIPLAVWGGIYLHKLVLGLLEKKQTFFNHYAQKPFMLSPIMKNSSCIGHGMLLKDDVYMFRITTLSQSVLRMLIEALYQSSEIPIVPIRIESKILKLEIPSTNRNSNKKLLIELKLRFYPTMFKFRGYTVLYPSPMRLLTSAVRDLHMARKIDLRPILRKVFLNVELISYNTKIQKLYIGKDMNGRDRYLRAFQGEASFIIVAEGHKLPLLNMLLEITKHCGVGKNRSIGLGYVEVVKQSVIKSVK